MTYRGRTKLQTRQRRQSYIRGRFMKGKNILSLLNRKLHTFIFEINFFNTTYKKNKSITDILAVLCIYLWACY